MSVTFFEAGLTALLESPTGPVARNVTAKAELVEQQARQNVQSFFRTRTGNLERSIGSFPEEGPFGLQIEIGTDGAPYGLYLERGTPGHEILPINTRILVSEAGHPDPLLAPRFRVFHPGFPPRPWLLPALQAVFTGG